MSSPVPRIALVSCLILALFAPPLGSAARADRGVSVDIGNISVDERLAPGGRYRLPTLTVRNVGDEEGDYEMIVAHFKSEDATDAPIGWFDVSPSHFHLAPNQEQHVQLHIELPPSADQGRYSALIEAHAVANASGVQVTAAAASRVSFEVKASSTWAAWLVQLRRSFTDHYPWSYLTLGAISVVLLAALARRFVRLRIGLERRR